MEDLRNNFDALKEQEVNGLKIKAADEFSYTDPVTHEVTSKQGIRIFFETGERIIFRVSGTGTQGATIRVYFEKYVQDADKLTLNAQDVLAPLVKAGLKISRLPELTGREKPSVIT